MFWSKRTVFFSYRDAIPEDNVRAEKLAERFRKRRFWERRLKPILEADKKRQSQDLPSALYDQLSEADAVVSILSVSAMQSRYIYFEALTGKLQKKWFPVVFDDVSIPEELAGPYRTSIADAQLDDPDDPSIAALARSIRQGSSAAKLYYGTTRQREGRKNIFIVAVGLLAAVAGFLSNLGNIRTQLCANTYFAAICERAGWPIHGHGIKG